MIYVECKPDATLVLRLTGLRRRQVVHELKGKAEICKKISQRRDSKALLDEDPGNIQPTYLQMIRLSRDMREHGIKIYRDESRGNQVFVLCPTLEEWILAAARSASIDVTKYSLPTTQSRLHRVIRGILKKCVNGQAVYPLSEQDGLKAQERRYTAYGKEKH